MFSSGDIEQNSKGNSILTSLEKSFPFKAPWDYFSLTRRIQTNFKVLNVDYICKVPFALRYYIHTGSSH